MHQTTGHDYHILLYYIEQKEPTKVPIVPGWYAESLPGGNRTGPWASREIAKGATEAYMRSKCMIEKGDNVLFYYMPEGRII